MQGTNFVIVVLRPDSGIRIHWREGHLIRPCYEHLGNLETKTAQKLLGTDSAGVPRLMLVPSPTHYWSEMPNNNILGWPSSFGFLCYITRKKLEYIFLPTQYIHLICWHESFVFFPPPVITIGIALHAAKSELPGSASWVCPRSPGGWPICSCEPAELLISYQHQLWGQTLQRPPSHGRSWIKQVLPLSHSFLAQKMGTVLAF